MPLKRGVRIQITTKLQLKLQFWKAKKFYDILISGFMGRGGVICYFKTAFAISEDLNICFKYFFLDISNQKE
jgi:hypothetical protein